MKAKRVLALALSVMFVFSVVPSLFAADAAPEEPKILGVGDMFEELSLADQDGTMVSFNKDIKGKNKRTAILFMNTACSACMMEATLLNNIAKGRDDMGVVAILVDNRGAAAAKTYSDSQKFEKISYLIDKDFTIPQKYGFTFTPAMVLLDEGGKILMSKGGFMRAQSEAFTNEVRKLL